MEKLKSKISRLPFNAIYLLIAFLFLSYWAYYFGGMGNSDARGFVQDDTYISLRYARNLIEGQGLVMNPGQKVEGYTNFLWTMIMALALKWTDDAVSFMRGLGFALSLATALLLFLTAKKMLPPNRWARGWSTVLFATSPIVGLWTTSGMETPLMTFWVASLLFIHAHETALPSDKNQARKNWGLCCGLILALAELTRPEGKALFLVLSACQLFPFSKEKFWKNVFLKNAAGAFFLLVIPYHLWRLIYFGEFVPNTYYVKGVHSLFAYERGFEMLKEFFSKPTHISIALFALGNFFSKTRVQPLFLPLGVAAFYGLYYIKIGGDEFYLYRQLMPFLPAFVLLGEAGVSRWMGSIREWVASKHLQRLLTFGLVGLVAYMAQSGFFFGRKQSQYCTVLETLEVAHGAVGRFIAERSKVGDKVITQDMGILPWNAPQQTFIDVMGLTDSIIAKRKAALGYSVYTRQLMEREESMGKKINVMYHELREYLFSQNAKWVVATTYFNSEEEVAIAQESMHRRDTAYFVRNFRESHFYFKLASDPRFDQRYVPIGLWKYSTTLYLVLFVERAALPTLQIPES